MINVLINQSGFVITLLFPGLYLLTKSLSCPTVPKPYLRFVGLSSLAVLWVAWNPIHYHEQIAICPTGKNQQSLRNTA